MDEKNVMLHTDEQQRLYVDTIFAMAALDGFKITGTTGHGDNTPVGCEKQMGKYFVEISCLRDSEDEQCTDLTKAIWEVEMNEGEPEDETSRRSTSSTSISTRPTHCGSPRASSASAKR